MTRLSHAETLLAGLVAFPTVSSASNLDMIEHMANMLSDSGARVDIFKSPTGDKANLFATLGPDQPGGVMLSGHSDVVPVTDQDWTCDPFTLLERDGRLYGRGTCDMKGFIAACLAMAPQYAAQPLRRPVHYCFTYDEEIGCLGARALVPELQGRGLRPDSAIIGEPTSMRIIEGHKGCCEYTTRFSGSDGHGSAPDLGVNAVIYAMRYAQRLLELAQALKARAPADSRFDPPWTTVNIGRLSGGTAHNIIAGKAELDWEMRPVVWEDANFVKSALEDFVRGELLPEMRRVAPGSNISTEIIGEVVGLVPMAVNEARDLVARLTGGNTAETVPFGTEAGLFQQMGTHVVVCGPGDIAQAHKPDEFLERNQLGQCLSMLERLADHLTA